MTRRNGMNGLVLTVALMIGAGPFVVHAAGRHADPTTVANVDMARVYAESEVRKTNDQKARDFGIKLYAHFDTIQKMQYLKLEEIQDYSNAATLEKPMEKDTKTISDVKKLSTSRTEEYQGLLAKDQAKLTQLDKDRLKELTRIEQARPQLVENLQRLFQEEVNREAERQTRLGVAEIRTAVTKLARDQNIGQVFDTSALVVAPTDITEAAIKKTGAKKK
ncbi:MAG: hypothetical protein ABJA67_00260 [Chthonomonadales bacterium]